MATWKKLAFEDEVVLETLFDAQSILAATADNTPAALTLAEGTLVGRATGGNVAALNKATVLSILNVEDGADVTDSANVNTAGAVMEPDYTAKGDILVASAASTPAVLTIGDAGQVLTVAAGTAVWAAPAAAAAHAASHMDGAADELTLDDFGEPTAAVDFDGQQAEDLVVHNVADAAARGALTGVVGKICYQVDTSAYYICTVGD